MKVTLRSVLLALMLANSALAFALDDQVYSCSRDEHIRRVVIDYQSNNSPVPCQVIYSKDTEGGSQKTLWQAQTTAGYCEKKAEEFVNKLDSWGWKCKLELSPTKSN